MKKRILAILLCSTVAATTPLTTVCAKETITQQVGQFFDKHGALIALGAFCGIAAGIYFYPYLTEDNKPTGQTILEAEQVIKQVAGKRFVADYEMLLTAPDLNQAIMQVVYAEFPYGFFGYPFLSYVSELNTLTYKVSYHKWAVERRLNKINKTDIQHAQLLQEKLKTLEIYDGILKTLRETISSHTEYFREWRSKNARDWSISPQLMFKNY